MLEQLKRINLDTLSLEEAIASRYFARVLRAEFEAAGAEVPEWLDRKVRDLNRWVESSKAEQAAKRQMELEAQIAALETPSEKKRRLQAELAKLKGVPDAPAVAEPVAQ